MLQLNELDDVPWARLRTSLMGAGHRLPALLTVAADPAVDAGQAAQALAEVERIVLHCGMISEAAAYLPRFIARIARRPEVRVRAKALDVLDTIAVASPASVDEAGDQVELPYTVRRELMACLPDLRAVSNRDALRLVSLIESGTVPGGVVPDRWRTRARPFIDHPAARLFPGTLDGRAILITTDHNWPSGISCWDAATGERLGPAQDGIALHTYGDSSGLVVAGTNASGRPQRWRMPFGQHLPEFEQQRGRSARVAAMTSYRDGERRILVSGDEKGVIQRFDTATREPTGKPIRLADPVTAVWTFNVAGQVGLAAGDEGGQVWRWLPVTDPEPRPVAGKHCQLVLHGTAYTEGGRAVLVTGATDQAAYRWDAETGEQIGDIRIMEDVVGGICTYMVDGRRIVAVGGLFQVQRFDALTGDPFGELIQGHPEPIIDTRFAEVLGRPVLFTCDTFSVWRWDAITGEPLPAS